jgi:hypothetical protein
MKRHLLGAVVGALALGAIPLSASADPLPIVNEPAPLEAPTLRGDGHFWIIFGSSLTWTEQVEFGCTAMASARVVATWVDCELKQAGAVVATSQAGNESVFSWTVPQVVELPIDAVEVCWKARSLLTDGTTYIYDEGCRS